ncbi:MAG: BrnA antitoxin family protein [Oscillospiraceae bacterium]|nr:BrnA antitoxin family protein [Oscillospiraceae bacterium]
MKKEIKYTDAPEDVEESMDRSVVIPNFVPSPENVKMLAEKRTKKQVSIYLSTDTINKFKAAAKRDGSRYQTMISNVLDTYTEQYLYVSEANKN